MPKAYSVDLREKIISAWIAEEGSYRVLAQRFKVSLSFIQNLIGRYKQTGKITAMPQGGDRRSKVKGEDLEALKEIVIKENDLYLREIQSFLKKSRGIEVSISSICNTLKKLELNRKKKFNS